LRNDWDGKQHKDRVTNRIISPHLFFPVFWFAFFATLIFSSLYRLLLKGSGIETVDRLLAFTQFKSSLAKKWPGKKMKTSKTTIFLPPHLFAPLQTTDQGFGNRNSRSIACIHSIQVILGKKMVRQKDEDIQNYHLFASSSFCPSTDYCSKVRKSKQSIDCLHSLNSSHPWQKNGQAKR
jgi:hypothetical protein